MSGKDIAAASAALTSNGGTDGTLTMASTAGFRVGSRCNLSSSGVTGVEVIVVEIVSGTVLRAAPITPAKNSYDQGQNYKLNALSYGSTTSWAAYTTAQTATLDASRQFIYNEV